MTLSIYRALLCPFILSPSALCKNLLMNRSWLLYLSIAASISLWWYCFLPPIRYEEAPVHKVAKQLQSLDSSPIPLSPLNRSQLQEALRGNVSTMHQLMLQWEADADLLESAGVTGVLRPLAQKRQEARLLAHSLLFAPSSQLELLRKERTQSYVQDDHGTRLSTQTPALRILPQTFTAAHILLALVDHGSLVALPSGLRTHPHLFPDAVYESIPLDANRYRGEELFSSRPDLAFVAFYSLPSVCQALEQQGVPLFLLNHMDSSYEVSDAIERLGQVCGRPLKGRLLSLFVDAALMALDNHLLAQRHYSGQKAPRLLYLRRYNSYTSPDPASLNGSLLLRQGLTHWMLSQHSETSGSKILGIEEIRQLDPDCMILAGSPAGAALNSLQKEPGFAGLKAIKEGRVYAVDADIQDEPSQFFVLAYFDICHCLLEDLQR